MFRRPTSSGPRPPPPPPPPPSGGAEAITRRPRSLQRDRPPVPPSPPPPAGAAGVVIRPPRRRPSPLPAGATGAALRPTRRRPPVAPIGAADAALRPPRRSPPRIISRRPLPDSGPTPPTGGATAGVVLRASRGDVRNTNIREHVTINNTYNMQGVTNLEEAAMFLSEKQQAAVESVVAARNRRFALEGS